MKTIERTLLASALLAVTAQATVAAINWNMTKDWPQYSTKTSATDLGGLSDRDLNERPRSIIDLPTDRFDSAGHGMGYQATG